MPLVQIHGTQALGRIFTPYGLEVNEGSPLELSAKDGWLDIILPVGPGGSASVLQASGGGSARAEFVDGELTVAHISESGDTWQGPAMTLKELKGLRVRVCVTGADGKGKAFVITDWDEARADPVDLVVDLFGGKIPLQKGDYSLSTDTLRLNTGTSAVGSCAIEYDRHLYVRGKIPGGGEGWFLLDTGGATTAVVESILPPDLEVNKAQAVQYSSAGRQLVKYAPGGATGSVDTVVGTVGLETFEFGELQFKDTPVVVLSEFPDIFGRPVVGILGLDLLRRAPRCRFDFSEEGAKLTLLDKAEDEKRGSSGLPFTYVRGHLVVSIKVNNTPMCVILDTGSPDLFLDDSAAKAAGIKAAEGEDSSGRGLDEGGRVTVRKAKGMQQVRLGSNMLVGPKTSFGSLPVFSTLNGSGQYVGLLGNSVASGFASMEIDFTSNRIRFVR
jgi:hypothetical protein